MADELSSEEISERVLAKLGINEHGEEVGGSAPAPPAGDDEDGLVDQDPGDYTDEQVAAAQMLGLDATVLEQMTPAALDRVLAAARYNQPAADGAPAPIPAATVPEPTKKEVPAAGSLDLDGLLEDSDEFTGDLIRQVVGYFEGRIAGMQQQYEAAIQQSSTSNEAAVEQQFDATIASLGEPYQGVFGEGAYASLSPNSPQYQARARVVREASAIQLGREQIGEPMLPLPELFKRAVAALYGNQAQSFARKEIAGKVGDRARQQIGRPKPRRKTQPDKSVDPAYQRAIRMAMEMGVPLSQEDRDPTPKRDAFAAFR